MCRTLPSPGSRPAHTWLHLCSSSQQLQQENATLLMDEVREPYLPWHFGFWFLLQGCSSNTHRPLQGTRF